jgi:transcription-repair coupling factor (superfamily II helicase)
MEPGSSVANIFRDSILKTAGFQQCLNALQKRLPNFSISGLSGSMLSLFIANLYQSSATGFLLIADNVQEAEELRDDLVFLVSSDRVAFLPPPEKIKPVFHQQDLCSYFANDTIEKLLGEKAVLTITTNEGLQVPLRHRKTVIDNVITLHQNLEYQRDVLVQKLADLGYQRVDSAMYPLEFAVKGSIVDFYTSGISLPCRIEFNDNRIASIRTYHPDTQLSVSKQTAVTLFPPVQPDSSNLQDHFDNVSTYLPESTVICLLHAEKALSDLAQSQKSPRELDSFGRIDFNDYLSSTLQYHTNYPNFPNGEIASFKKYLRSQVQDHPTANIFVITSSQDQADRLQILLKDFDVKIASAVLAHGFEAYDLGIFIYVDHEIFARRHRETGFKQIAQNLDIQTITADGIETGDYMVHLNYGIGRYMGLKKIDAFGAERECLDLEYRDGDRVYVPLERLKDVQKYKSKEGFVPTLNKLGSVEWEKVKLRTRRSIQKITDEIVHLYAQRMRSTGFAYAPDSDLQLQLESEFTFDETPDQVKATLEIKTDMESSTPMDRLLCGDVGFGKTEVAIRSAFKAVSNSKQVAVLVPTTILADQHYRTFCERLKKYPVSIRYLSRFVGRKLQQQTVLGLQDGSIDIIIGTHRLLSEDIHFKSLGLLIIDEEHRFGVRSKDRIKKLRLNVDVLSLSATPIPRTMQMSLMGVRDFSIINTPPRSRLPIFTEIVNFDVNLIKYIVLREIDRGGQVFFVHNRIHSIASMTRRLQQILPGLKIYFAHGQMTEREIEPIMNDFINQKVDLLVTTAIIESGIDIPNANTIIINRADQFGLSQLYQLRGRVGRGNRRAYAYLIVPPPSQLNPIAIKRLQTIQRYTSLGSGYSIAVKDLEIRGAGNMFGLEQSGNIQAIGYELYMKILQEALTEIKDSVEGPVESATAKINEPEIICPYPAFFPEIYVASPALRLEFYQKLSEVVKSQAVDQIEAELKDRFGPLPAAGKSLLELTRVRILAASIGITRIKIQENFTTLSFAEPPPTISAELVLRSIREAAEQLKLRFKFVPSDNFQVYLYLQGLLALKQTKQFLDILRLAFNL